VTGGVNTTSREREGKGGYKVDGWKPEPWDRSEGVKGEGFVRVEGKPERSPESVSRVSE
jgi:hypothetical protein